MAASILIAARHPTAADEAGMAQVMAALRRDSDDLAIPQREIVAFISLGHPLGLSIRDVERGLTEVGLTAHEAKYGRDLPALSAQTSLGLELKFENGQPLMGDYLLQLADAISKQRDPYTRVRTCELLGCVTVRPVLQLGRQALETAIEQAAQRGVPE